MALRQEELTGLCDDVDLERDRALVERCQSGDSAAFGNLYARYYERLLRFCMRRLNDRHEAEDAAQEAFARAWKALPRFSGDKRFYPWLTVIAGNICTDMLRRRSRSTPTEDMELTAQQPLGVVADDTSEELVLAAVDGELVNRALGRLSTRHRDVLAMREGSGWTYQQIADHEGVEIGTIETLLWRARQALKREFAAVSDSNGALAGFLVASAALFKRTLFRVAHRGASVQQQAGAGSPGEFGLRNALAGMAVAGAAIAAALITPHALASVHDSTAGNAPAASALAAPSVVPATGSTRATGSGLGSGSGSAGPSSAAGGSGGGAIAGNGGGSGSGVGSSGARGSGNGAGGLVGALSGGLTGGGSSGGVGNAVSQGIGQTTGGVNNAVSNLGSTVDGVTNDLGGTVTGVTNGLNNTLGGATGGLTGGVTGGVNDTVNGVTSGVTNTVNGVAGAVTGTVGGVTQGVTGLLGGGGGGGSGSGASASTTTTTTPSGLLGGLLGGH